MITRIEPIQKLCGEIAVPGDKSISHRAIMCGAIAEGKTVVRGLLDCDDCNFTIRAFKDMGIRVEQEGGYTSIYGNGLRGLKRPAHPINLGESGTGMRILPGILAGQDFAVTLTGARGLLKRPMKRVIEPLTMMGVGISSAGAGVPPLKIKGGSVNAIDYKLPVSSAQVKSAILYAGLYSSGLTTVEEKSKSRDHTERMLKHFGADVKAEGMKVSVRGSREMAAKEVEIPGDISSASFFLAGACLLNSSNIIIKKVGINPSRAGILSILSRMGARVKVRNTADSFEPYGDIEVKSGPINGITIGEDEIPGIIDELPILFVLASLAKGRTIIRGAEELRVKETDRIASMKENLEKMGGKVSVGRAAITIDGVKRLRGSKLKSYGDHRTCMAMTIAALTAEGPSSMDDVICVNKSFPEFYKLLDCIKC